MPHEVYKPGRRVNQRLGFTDDVAPPSAALLPRCLHHGDALFMTATPSTLLDRSAAGLVRRNAKPKPSAPPRASIPGAPTAPGRSHVGGGMLPPPANTVALSDGTRISFRAVDELPELVD
jgi:hypothetical protein